jgi:PAS domain-containing protein
LPEEEEDRRVSAPRVGVGVPDDDLRNQIHHLNQTLQMALCDRTEELSAKNSEIFSERRRFQNLSIRAPVGYVILDQGNIIREADATSAVILISPSRHLVGEDFSSFISPEFRDSFFEHRNKAQPGKRDSLELELLTTIKKTVYARLDTCLDSDARYQVAMIDITERKTAEEKLKKTRDELQFLCERLRDEMVYRRKAEEELRRFALKLIDVQESERQKTDNPRNKRKTLIDKRITCLSCVFRVSCFSGGAERTRTAE